MKYLIKMMVLLTMAALVSCEKAVISEESELSGNKNGNLRVSVFQIEKTAFSPLTRATASEACTRLSFAVYDENGSRLKQINQNVDDSGFGTASFQIDEGDYQLVVVGHSSNGNPTMSNPQKIQFSNAQGFTDTFLFSSEITIGEEPVDLQVTLERIVALCRFVITDDTPAEVAKMKFYYTGGSGAFNAYTGFGSVNSKQEATFDVTSGQKQFDLYTFLHEQSDNIALKVTALDAAGNTQYEREFDVPMEQNHITWLTGAFFDGSGSSLTTVTGVTVNTDWAGETHLTF